MNSAWVLWLNPDKDSLSQFNDIVKSLSTQSPPSLLYDPHVTLLGDIPLSIPLDHIRSGLKTVISKCAQSGPLKCIFSPITTSESYFHCVIAPVELSGELKSLRDASAEIWGDKGSLFPHMSLKYATADEGRRGELVQRARKEEIPKEWTTSGIAIVRCDGTPDTWQIVETVPFGKEGVS